MGKKKSKQITFLIDVSENRHIDKFTHASMPLHLYEHLFRTACDWAMNGDSIAAQWVMDELTMLDREHVRAEYYNMRGKGTIKDALHGLPCVVCGKPSDTVDHIIPLSKGGTNDPANLQPMCRRCNSKKSAKLGDTVKEQ
jgi:hypothetical protein